MTVKKGNTKLLLILLSIILIFGCCYYIFIEIILKWDQPVEPEVVASNYGAYEYDPQTILVNTDLESSEMFHEIDYEIGMNLPKEDIEITPFSDEEFYQISSLLLDYISDGSSGEWKLVRVIYTYHDCEKKTISSSFAYEREIFQNGEKFVEIRGFEITTFSNVVEWSDKVERRDSIRKTIDWDGINYYPSNIFDIAQMNGGNVFQTGQLNNCGEIVMRLYGHDKNWSVNYYDNEDWLNIFNLEVNAKTGKVTK